MSQDTVNKQSDHHAKQSLLKPVSWLAQLDFVNHLLLFNNVMLVAFAEKQGGKSTYMQFLQQNLSDTFDTYTTQSKVPHDEGTIVAGLANHLNLVKPKQATMADICHQVNERGHHTLLIIDDAHNLPQKQVEALLDIVKSQPQTPYFHVLLLADYTLLPLLNQLSSKDAEDAIHSIELGPFAKDEIKTYLYQKVTDERLRTKINAKTCDRFYQLTKGQIATMNHEMASFSSSVTANKGKLFNRVKQFSALAAVLLLGFISIQLWQGFDLRQTLTLVKQTPTHPNIASKNASYPNLAKAQVFEDTSFPLTSRLNKIKVPYQEPAVESHLAMVKMEQLADGTKLTQPSTHMLESTLHAAIKAPSIDEHTKFKPETESKPTLVVKAGVSQQPEKATVTQPIDSKLVSIQFAKAPPQKSKLPPKYTIQLVATHQIKFLKALSVKFPVTSLKIYTYPIKQNGEQWFILTAGQFTTWSEAHDALSKLPAEYQKFQPWIRPIDKV
ncbi:AAA family ATPase [Legionella sp. W05-934-2]|jgi:DamX protein|uniref:AAA family ATPase n=1 Tax=Legionella sp. W05-934-2 TaxID=1198649 RepID=UPI0034617CFB